MWHDTKSIRTIRGDFHFVCIYEIKFGHFRCSVMTEVIKIGFFTTEKVYGVLVSQIEHSLLVALREEKVQVLGDTWIYLALRIL